MDQAHQSLSQPRTNVWRECQGFGESHGGLRAPSSVFCSSGMPVDRGGGGGGYIGISYRHGVWMIRREVRMYVFSTFTKCLVYAYTSSI